MAEKYGDIYSSIFMMLFALLMYISTFNMQSMAEVSVGPETVPQIVAIGIFIFSVILLLQGIKKVKSYSPPVEPEGTKDETENDYSGKKSLVSVLITLLLVICYVLVMPILGFIISSTLYLIVQFCFLAKRENWNIPLYALIAVVVSVSVYFFFRNLFYLMLPQGILG
ncbi:tripartite tricarboxylate transporter TctB family protein [Desertibacillus haloalkaliphilus]|uniref:tripartite tricarboxylate transporter TctB family protein n=1 Tax=Desertibacillus haloalkaliphilus TaxID=1328930 RepID=UPI001C266F8A|nr:tripartite tricarboxylate transporter TctB family protein [Desertibacillus haloalkaliphilus]MBU8906470.1 tripartite tricarboxylate transporter TctB family protein [Desertibacillus haloalkaliphilus]